ncbi:hypothetical protein [Xanthomonas arboricola]|uniref:hypothetical protein n=1 Tax=Xanthomonas arboricola TaxID=56448 RepID=UPI00209C5CCC|nr:hypothetical protein [Xanthomonas arboricola]
MVDLFAGGDGASEALKQALGVDPALAYNHDEWAIGMHAANHPLTIHYREDIWHADPRKDVAGRPIGWFHASPDYTHFSQAQGAQTRSRKTRVCQLRRFWTARRWAMTDPNQTAETQSIWLTSAFSKHGASDLCIIYSTLPYRSGTCRPHSLKIACNQRQHRNKKLVRAYKFLNWLFIKQDFIVVVCGGEHAHGSDQPGSRQVVEIVISIRQPFRKWERYQSHVAHDVFPVGQVGDKVALALLFRQMCMQFKKALAIGADFCGYLNQQENSFFLVACELAVRFLTSQADSQMTRVVGCFSQPIGDKAQYRRRDHRRQGTNCRPGVPPHDASVLPNLPTLTEAKPPIHSLTPLCVYSHSAMAAIRQEFAHG